MGRAGFYVMADVGNVDLQRVVAIRETVHPDGVIEIARGFAIDGHDVERAEILAASQLVGANGVREVLRLVQNFGRKMMRDMVLADDDFDVDAEVVRDGRGFR